MAANHTDVEAREMINASESDGQVVTSRRPSQTVKLAGVVSVALLLAALVAWFGSRGTSAANDSAEQVIQLATIDTSQKNWTVTIKERDLCAGKKDNCLATGCCKTSSHKCIKESPTLATCAPSCAKGKPCTVVTESLTFDVKEHTSLFCFSVYTDNTGSPKKSYEKELLAQQYEKKVSIFACDAYDVYSDVATSITSGLSTIKVDDVENDFHFAKRKTTGAWVNTGMFSQVWKAIGRKGAYSSFDWTVKVDPDAVFFPAKLQDRVHLMPVPPSGAFLQNCEKVDYGFFGNLEVFSKTAFSILVSSVDNCKRNTVSNWKIGVDGGKHGPMGEDLFAQICMEKNGVAKLDAFDITKDGACEAKRPLDQQKNKKWHADCSQAYTPAIHPFKKPEAYFKCLDQAQGLK